jgi:protocatechuate 3,4-dioxygenase beta subunit
MDQDKNVRRSRASHGRSPRPAYVFVGIALLVAAAAQLSVVADDGKPGSAPSAPSDATAAPAVFDLRVVDPDGKPIPDAKVNLSTQPAIDKVRLKAGKLLNKPRSGVNLLSDADGRVIVERPAHLEYFNFRIHKPGYGYYWSWSNSRNKSDALLKPITVKLERAWTVGGLVIDSEGKPVPNVRILLHIRFAGMGQLGLSDRLFTNSKGIWKFDSVPESMSQVQADLSEPKFVTANPMLSRKEFEIKPGHEPTGKITLKTGVTITGRVTDENGKPIAKALVRTRVGTDTRSAFSDKKGAYRLEGCGTTEGVPGGLVIAQANGVVRKIGGNGGQAAIVASAKGRAAEVQYVAIGPDHGPVNFELKPGKTLRVRILDDQGHPAPNGTVYIQAAGGNYDYFQFDRAPRQADTDGVWEWHEAPGEQLMASIGRPNGMTLNNRPLQARDEEYVFRVPPALVVSGKVVDAETHQPIKVFRAVRGSRWNAEQPVYWDTNNKVSGAEGTYQIRQNWEQHALLVRIEADGYLHGVSREIKSDEGKIEVDFELLKGEEVAAAVLTPEGTPAGGARVAIVGGDVGFVINHGDIDVKGGRRDVQEADAAGRFRIATKNDDFWVVVTHPSGYAELTGLSNSNPRVIKLAPWARIEGVFQLSHRPQPDVEISLNNAMFFGRNQPPIAQDSQTTDLHGRFAFERVMPGKRRITAKRTSGEGDSETTFSKTMMIDCPAGKTSQVDFGSGGRPVIGQLEIPADSKLDLQIRSAQIYMSQRGEGRQVDAVMFTATPDRKGNFAIDDVPPGNYNLNAFISARGDGYTKSHQFTVPKVSEKLSQRPVDLGVLTLERFRRFRGAAKK